MQSSLRFEDKGKILTTIWFPDVSERTCSCPLTTTAIPGQESVDPPLVSWDCCTQNAQAPIAPCSSRLVNRNSPWCLLKKSCLINTDVGPETIANPPMVNHGINKTSYDHLWSGLLDVFTIKSLTTTSDLGFCFHRLNSKEFHAHLQALTTTTGHKAPPRWRCDKWSVTGHDKDEDEDDEDDDDDHSVALTTMKKMMVMMVVVVMMMMMMRRRRRRIGMMMTKNHEFLWSTLHCHSMSFQ